MNFHTPTRLIIPASIGFWKKDYITYRRLWLDSCLTAFADEMRGKVVDIGGKRKQKRGTFSPPEAQSQSWWYVNLDMDTNPNICADAAQVPLSKKSVDCIICTEVLEHLPNPQSCVDEMHRLLKDGGVVFATVPFFYPVHADPHDFQRFTEDGLHHLFRNFTSVEILRMGGFTGVLGLQIEIGIAGVEGNRIFEKIVRWTMKWVARWLCWYDLKTFGSESDPWKKFTTGYLVRAFR